MLPSLRSSSKWISSAKERTCDIEWDSFLRRCIIPVQVKTSTGWCFSQCWWFWLSHWKTFVLHQGMERVHVMGKLALWKELYQCYQGKVIRDASDLFQYWLSQLTNKRRAVFCVEDNVISRQRPEHTLIKTLPQTRKLPVSKCEGTPNVISTRSLSCFCHLCITGEGVCEYVFNPFNTHVLV